MTVLQLFTIYLHTSGYFESRPAPRIELDAAAVAGINRSLTPRSGAASKCSALGVSCANALLAVINKDRQLHNARPLTLDWTLTKGAGGCEGSAGHARHLASIISDPRNLPPVAHDQFPHDVCGPYSSAGENVGMAYGTKYTSMLDVLNGMLAEPWIAGCVGTHACNLRSTSFTRIGIGFAPDGNDWIVVQDLTG